MFHCASRIRKYRRASAIRRVRMNVSMSDRDALECCGVAGGTRRTVRRRCALPAPTPGTVAAWLGRCALTVIEAIHTATVRKIAVGTVVGVLHALRVALALHTKASDLVAGRCGRRTHVLGATFGTSVHTTARRSFADRSGRAVLVRPTLDAAVKCEIAARCAAAGTVRIAATSHAQMRDHVAVQRPASAVIVDPTTRIDDRGVRVVLEPELPVAT